MAAGRLVLKAIGRAMEHRRSFVYETTLSSHQSLSVMERCKELGYEVSIVFVALDTADLNVRRVAERVARGGHDIPEDVIRRRYRSAFGRLPSALRLADGGLVFDNSRLTPEMLLTLRAKKIIANRLDKANALHVRLADALSQALELAVDQIFMSGRSI